jgi:hypothetical protein
MHKDKRAWQHCRHCNIKIPADSKKCPHCKRAQSYIAEICALIFLALVTIAAICLQHYNKRRLAELDQWVLQNNQTTQQARTPTTPLAKSQTKPKLGPEPKLEPSFSFFNSKRLKRQSHEQLTNPQAETKETSTYSNYQNSRFKQERQIKFPFYVARKQWNEETQTYDFYRIGMQGSERVLKSDARRYFLSENQSDYPEPESGCGPTALLNLYIWYTKFGLIKESVRHSDPDRYKQLKFLEIDRKIAEIQGHARDSSKGTNTLEQVIAIDEILQANSKSPIRMHFELKSAPLKTQDFIRLSRNYRAGILIVRPKNRRTGQLMNYHAVLAIRGDTSGKISIANWGDFSHGRLIQKSDGQWFIPDDSTQSELQIDQLITLIPFTPSS